ncbi:MAG TPA: VCBS repeat-containing protein, partial [Patescibacteria group bacterium]|nr:VCBS repeat-containing protein [Patescibacteria group bacterium]
QFGNSYILAGDFNNDHKLDLAALGLLGVSVFPGNGNGTFQLAVATSGPAELDQLAEGDFNGDGKTDLVFDNYGANTVSVMLGNGNGSFRTPVGYNAGTNVQSVAVGDFNGDGKNDLAVGGQGAAFPPNGNVTILLGNGDGTFRLFTNYLSGWFVSVAVADFNADGKSDLAAVDAAGNQVDVMLGNGDGTFRPAYAFAVENGAAFVVAGDLNGDGLPDLAVVNSASGNVSVLLNTHVSVGPSLTVAPINAVDNKITFSWAVSAAGYTLETLTNLALANWQPPVGIQTTNNGNVNFTVSIGQGSHFFRLQKQP